jgi:phosphoribosyl 1,2-cyclic phosphate phosphodiesterase
MKLVILGSGTSHGIPVVSCSCPVCRSDDQNDKRTRASLFVEGAGGEHIVIDTGPEWRIQAIRAGIMSLDAVFYTHSHADHLHGLDDLRYLTRETPLPAYGNAETIRDIEARFSYIFKETLQAGGGKPRITLHLLDNPVHIGGLTVTPVPVMHGKLAIYGWKITEGEHRAAYITDASHIPDASFALIKDIGTLIIGALRVRPHETHFNFEQALEAAFKIRALQPPPHTLKQVYFTHICHDHSHQEIIDLCRVFLSKTPSSGLSLAPAYDGCVAGVPVSDTGVCS